ncbi:acid protease [Coniophora puteana RWD-64-598 SS2]|uniref:Acid protease n=1 Tax=Coniophora puteana (strain RWD-64-598) TaxID=741705 RepID=A0A5M3N0T4_CONPW|nr:acid protease [Coniophora puteana RWD-64-598 SS2]EIW84515.1 acid protease [Coniophora puteana RWD-64-598 SS2]
MLEFSSDLWTNKEITDATDQQLNGTINYAIGGASGKVLSSTLEFAGYSVPDQYFVYAPDGKVSAGDGVLGLGPAQDSRIRSLRNTSAANPPIDRIFSSDNSTDNYIAVLLGRGDEISSSDAPGDASTAASSPKYPGDLSICSVLPKYASVRNQPKLDVTQVPRRLINGQHWQVLLDSDGIKGTDGQRIEISSRVDGAGKDQPATVIFDTGYTFPQVPDDVAEALYKNVPGAKLEYVAPSAGNAWSLPCDAELSASFFFGGIEYPIHPLDLNFQAEDGTCFGGFQPYTVDPAKVDGGIVGYDMILGMAFLRNAYMLVDFGSYTDVGNTPDEGASFIQLLPLTNATEATDEFRPDVFGAAV